MPAKSTTIPAATVWERSKGTRRIRAYSLSSGYKDFGSITWIKSCGSLAVAQCGSEEWTFKRTGFFSPRISIRKSTPVKDYATFVPRWCGGGELEVAGRRYLLRHTSFWRGSWGWFDSDGTALVTLHRKGAFRVRCEVRLEPKSAKNKDTPLLICLGWYVLLLAADDSDNTATVLVAMG